MVLQNNKILFAPKSEVMFLRIEVFVNLLLVTLLYAGLPQCQEKQKKKSGKMGVFE